jgi:pimeloyl-ACP methyl ester carboxylesterase
MEIGLGLDRFYPTITPLSKHFHVFAVDELGCGDTDAPRDPKELEHISNRAKHIVRFIETLGIGPMNVLGQSLGGWIVTYITVMRPDLVRRLVLVDSASVSGSGFTRDGKPIPAPYMEQVFEAGTMVPKHDIRSREGLRKRFGNSLFDKSMVTEDLLDRLVALSAKWNDRYMLFVRDLWSHDGWSRRLAMRLVDGKQLVELVHTIERKTLVIWGRESKKDLDKGIELFKLIPDAEMHIFERANHFVWMDQPEKFNSLVTDFLKRDS